MRDRIQLSRSNQIFNSFEEAKIYLKAKKDYLTDGECLLARYYPTTVSIKKVSVEDKDEEGNPLIKTKFEKTYSKNTSIVKYALGICYTDFQAVNSKKYVTVFADVEEILSAITNSSSDDDSGISTLIQNLTTKYSPGENVYFTENEDGEKTVINAIDTKYRISEDEHGNIIIQENKGNSDEENSWVNKGKINLQDPTYNLMKDADNIIRLYHKEGDVWNIVPDGESVGDGKITVVQGGKEIGSFTVNQLFQTEINLDDTTFITHDDAITLINEMLDSYVNDGKFSVIDSEGVTHSEFTANQEGNTTLQLADVAFTGDYNSIINAPDVYTQEETTNIIQEYINNNVFNGKFTIENTDGVPQSEFTANQSSNTSLQLADVSFTGDYNSLTNLPDVYTRNEVNNLVNTINSFNVLIVKELPATGDEHTIYLVPKENEESGNIYNEYLYQNNRFELIGDTSVDLSEYYTSTQVDEMLTASIGNGLITFTYNNNDIGSFTVNQNTNSSIKIPFQNKYYHCKLYHDEDPTNGGWFIIPFYINTDNPSENPGPSDDVPDADIILVIEDEVIRPKIKGYKSTHDATTFKPLLINSMGLNDDIIPENTTIDWSVIWSKMIGAKYLYDTIPAGTRLMLARQPYYDGNNAGKILDSRSVYLLEKPTPSVSEKDIIDIVQKNTQVNNGVLTINSGTKQLGTFSANQSTDSTITIPIANITVNGDTVTPSNGAVALQFKNISTSIVQNVYNADSSNVETNTIHSSDDNVAGQGTIELKVGYSPDFVVKESSGSTNININQNNIINNRRYVGVLNGGDITLRAINGTENLEDPFEYQVTNSSICQALDNRGVYIIDLYNIVPSFIKTIYGHGLYMYDYNNVSQTIDNSRGSSTLFNEKYFVKKITLYLRRELINDTFPGRVLLLNYTIDNSAFYVPKEYGFNTSLMRRSSNALHLGCTYYSGKTITNNYNDVIIHNDSCRQIVYAEFRSSNLNNINNGTLCMKVLKQGQYSKGSYYIVTVGSDTGKAFPSIVYYDTTNGDNRSIVLPKGLELWRKTFTSNDKTVVSFVIAERFFNNNNIIPGSEIMIESVSASALITQKSDETMATFAQRLIDYSNNTIDLNTISAFSNPAHAFYIPNNYFDDGIYFDNGQPNWLENNGFERISYQYEVINISHTVNPEIDYE